MDKHAILEKEWKICFQRLLGGEFFARLQDGSITAEIYACFLRETFHNTRENPRIMSRFIGRIPPGREALAAKFLKHCASEMGHDLMAMEDLRLLGVDVSGLPGSRPLPTTAALAAFISYEIDYRNPIAMLGYSFHLESLPLAFGSKATGILDRMGVPKAAQSFLTEHVEADEVHNRWNREYMENFPRNEADFDALLYGLRGTCALHGVLFQGIVDHAYEFKSLLQLPETAGQFPADRGVKRASGPKSQTFPNSHLSGLFPRRKYLCPSGTECTTYDGAIFSRFLLMDLFAPPIQAQQAASATTHGALLSWSPPLPALRRGARSGTHPDLHCSGSRSGARLEFLARDARTLPDVGGILDVRIKVPSPCATRYRGRVIACEPDGDGGFRIATEPVSLPLGLAKALSAWLVFTAGISPEAVYRAGLPLRIFRGRLTYRYAETQADYDQVLELRRDAYVRVGKKHSATRPVEMAITWDQASRILCAYHGEKLVACAALGFPLSDEDVLLGETAFPGNRFPGVVPPRKTIFEINRLSLRKEYRGGDVRLAFFEQIGRVFLQSGRKWIYCVSDNAMKPLYLGMGFTDLGVKGSFLGKEHSLLRCNRGICMYGHSTTLVAWYEQFFPMVRHQLAGGFIRLRASDLFPLAFRLALTPIARMISLHRETREASKRFFTPTKANP